ncbi:Permease of the drug/metabolite transporter (DMT) superfamily [Flavobacterium urocaniciphilum]|uniref:Permease of the drug/metabolite transporter (DMT) superfamily n=2 Tax=Flavobacterium urocaniciphilum TaxID=1299341 RepID=A0A1H9CEF3_9FLAO|nr:Permease of the drug/metabolite transporter (DMT) superfamily [Flavobacterium urocaniciphilum]
MKKGLDGGMNAYQLGAYRIIFTSLFLLPILGKELFKIKKKKIKYIILAGLLGNFFPIFLFAVAQTEISSSISSTLNSFTPLNTLIIGSVFFGLTFSKKQIIGLLIGIVGCLTLVYAGASGNPTKNYWFALLVIIATWCYASNINLVKKHLHDVSPLAITVGNFAFLLLPALLILALNGFEFQIIQNSTESIGIFNSIHPLVYIAILGIIGTGLANIYFYRLIQMSSPIFASNVTYLIPVVATIWSVIFNENVTGLQVLGTAIILFGVYFTNRK